MYDPYSSHPKALFWLHPLKSRHLRHDSPGTTTFSSPGLESEVESATSIDGFLATAYEADDGKAGLKPPAASSYFFLWMLYGSLT